MGSYVTCLAARAGAETADVIVRGECVTLHPQMKCMPACVDQVLVRLNGPGIYNYNYSYHLSRFELRLVVYKVYNLWPHASISCASHEYAICDVQICCVLWPQ